MNIFFLGIWIVGGIISLIGALCYAELSAAFPSTRGDYHFLKLAFGKRFSFLYAWARIVVIQTGSIAMLAYIAGDYLSRLLSLGAFSSALYAASIIIIITSINVLGIRFGTGTQKLLTILQITGILMLIGAGLFAEPSTTNAGVKETVTNSVPIQPSISLAVIFVLLT
ncbi:MAG: amino acid permease, partial [Proteiniphilum sp.]|nr:amino acid permease [Proteiniphilum sp.]